MKIVRQLFEENPVLRYHLLGQTRHRLQNQTAVSTVIIVFAVLSYGFLLWQVLQYGIDASALSFFLLFLVCLLIPAASHSLLSGEYERSTWDALVLTRLPILQIVLGKWLSRFLMMALLITLFGAVFLVGSWHEVSPDYGALIARALWVIITWGCLILSFSLWVSNRTRNSLSAAALSFGGQFFFLLVVPMLLFATIGESELDVRTYIRWEKWETETPSEFPAPIFMWFLSWRMIYWLNPFVVLSDSFQNQYLLEDSYLEFIPGWGLVQGGYYLLGSWVFVWLTVRSLRRRDRKR